MKRNKKSCIGLSNCSFEQFKEGIDFLKQTDAILDDDIFPILKRVCSYLFFCVKNDNFEFVKSYESAERAGKAKGSQRAQVAQAGQATQAISAGQATSVEGAARMSPWRNASPAGSETTLNYEFEDEDFIIIKNINRLLLNKLIDNYVGYSWLCLTLTEYLNDLDYFVNKQGKSEKEEERKEEKKGEKKEEKEEEKKEINARKKVYKLVKKITQVKRKHELHNYLGGQPNGEGKKAIHKLEAKNKYINYLFCYYSDFFLSSNVSNGENAQGEDVIVLDHLDNAYRWIHTDEEEPSGGCVPKHLGREKHLTKEMHLDREKHRTREKRVRTRSEASPPTKRNAHLKRRRKCYVVKGLDGDQRMRSHTKRHGPFHEQVRISPGKNHRVHYERICDPSGGDKGREAKRERRREEKRQKRRLQRRLQRSVERHVERRVEQHVERREKRRRAPREESDLQHLYKALCDFLSTKYETSKLLKFMDEYRDMYAWKPPPFYWKILSSKYVVKEILKLYEDRYLDPFLSCLYEDYVNKYYFDDEENSNIATYTSNFNVFTLRVSEEIQRFLVLEEPEEEEAVFRICKNICVSENSYIYAQMILEYMYRNNNDNSMRRLSQFLSLYILYKDINLHRICNNYFAKVVENQVSITFLTFRVNNLNSYTTLYSTFRNIYMARNKGCMEINHSDIVSLHDAIVNVLKIFNGNKLLLFDSTYLFASPRGRNRLQGEATRERGKPNEDSTNVKRQLTPPVEGEAEEEDHSFHFHQRVEDEDFNSNFSNINRSNLEEVCRREDVLPPAQADDASSVRLPISNSPFENEESVFSKGEEIYNPSEDILPRGENYVREKSIGENYVRENSIGENNSLFGSTLEIGKKEKRNGADGASTEMNDNKTSVSNRSSKNLNNEIYSSIKSEDFVSNVNSDINEIQMKLGETKSTASELILPSASQYGNEDFNYNKEFLRINIYAEKIPLIHMRDIVFLNNAINIYVSNSELFFNNIYKLYGKVLIFLTTYSPYEYVYNHYYASFFKRFGEGASRKYSAAYFSVYDDSVCALDSASGDSDDEEAAEQQRNQQQQHNQKLLPHQRDDLRGAPEADAPPEANLSPGLSTAGKPTGKRTYEQFYQAKKEPEERKSILKKGSSYVGGGREVQTGKRRPSFDKHDMGDAAHGVAAHASRKMRRQEVDNAELAKRKRGEVPPPVLETNQTGQTGHSVLETEKIGQPSFGTEKIGQPSFGTEKIGQPSFDTEKIGQPSFDTEKIGQPSFDTEKSSSVTKENCKPAHVDSLVEAAKEGAPVEQENVTVSAAVERPTEKHWQRPPPNEAVQKGCDANVSSAGDANVASAGDANAVSAGEPLRGKNGAGLTTHPVQEAPARETFPPQSRDTKNSNASNTADDMLELRTEVMSCDEVRSSIFKNVKSKKKLKINPTSKKKKYYFYKLFQKFRLTYNTFLKYTQNEIYQIYQIIHGNYSDATKDKLLLARVNSNLAASLIYRYVYINVYEHVNYSRVNLLYPKFILLKYIVDKYPQKRHLALHFLKELYTYIIEKEESLEEFVELRENLILFFVYFVRFENMFCYVVGVIKSMVHLLDKALIRLFIIKTLAFCAPPYDFKFCECLLNFIHFVLKKEGVYYKNKFKRAIHKFLDNIAEMHRMYQSSKTKELSILCTHIREQIKQAEIDPSVH